MKNRQRFVRGVALFLAALMLFSLVFSAMGSIFASASYQSELDKLEDEKAELNSQKAEASKNAANLREQKASLVEQKDALDERNRLTQEEINKTKEQIEIYNQMIAEKQAEADAAQAEADAQLAVYKEHLRVMEENGTYNFYLSIVFGAGDFSELISRIDLISEIMEHDRRVEQSYKDARDAALTVKAEYEALNEELEAKKKQLEEESAKLEEEIAEAVALIEELEKQIKEYEAAFNRLVAQENSVSSSIANILAQMRAEEEAAKKEQEEQQKPDSGSSDSGSSGSSGGSEPAPSTPKPSTPSASTNVTGSFTWPAPGSRLVTSVFGDRLHPVLGYVRPHTGIDIGAGAGTPAVAADGGKVIQVINQGNSGYGLYVVIAHGTSLTTLYAHLSSASVRVGDIVTKGQTIGSVGASGLVTAPHLHFEVAINGGRVNPLSYLSGYSIWENA